MAMTPDSSATVNDGVAALSKAVELELNQHPSSRNLRSQYRTELEKLIALENEELARSTTGAARANQVEESSVKALQKIIEEHPVFKAGLNPGNEKLVDPATTRQQLDAYKRILDHPGVAAIVASGDSAAIAKLNSHLKAIFGQPDFADRARLIHDSAFHNSALAPSLEKLLDPSISVSKIARAAKLLADPNLQSALSKVDPTESARLRENFEKLLTKPDFGMRANAIAEAMAAKSARGDLPVSLKTLTNPELKLETVREYARTASNLALIEGPEFKHLEQTQRNKLALEATKRLASINELSIAAVDEASRNWLSKIAESLNDVNTVFDLIRTNNRPEAQHSLRPDQINAALHLLELNRDFPHLPIAFEPVLTPGANQRSIETYQKLLAQYGGTNHPASPSHGHKYEFLAGKAVMSALKEGKLKTGQANAEEPWVFVPSQHGSAADGMGVDGLLINMETGKCVPVDIANCPEKAAVKKGLLPDENGSYNGDMRSGQWALFLDHRQHIARKGSGDFDPISLQNVRDQLAGYITSGLKGNYYDPIAKSVKSLPATVPPQLDLNAFASPGKPDNSNIPFPSFVNVRSEKDSKRLGTSTTEQESVEIIRQLRNNYKLVPPELEHWEKKASNSLAQRNAEKHLAGKIQPAVQDAVESMAMGLELDGLHKTPNPNFGLDKHGTAYVEFKLKGPDTVASIQRVGASGKLETKLESVRIYEDGRILGIGQGKNKEATVDMGYIQDFARNPGFQPSSTLVDRNALQQKANSTFPNQLPGTLSNDFTEVLSKKLDPAEFLRRHPNIKLVGQAAETGEAIIRQATEGRERADNLHKAASFLKLEKPEVESLLGSQKVKERDRNLKLFAEAARELGPHMNSLQEAGLTQEMLREFFSKHLLDVPREGLAKQGAYLNALKEFADQKYLQGAEAWGEVITRANKLLDEIGYGKDTSIPSRKSAIEGSDNPKESSQKSSETHSTYRNELNDTKLLEQLGDSLQSAGHNWKDHFDSNHLLVKTAKDAKQSLSKSAKRLSEAIINETGTVLTESDFAFPSSMRDFLQHKPELLQLYERYLDERTAYEHLREPLDKALKERAESLKQAFNDFIDKHPELKLPKVQQVEIEDLTSAHGTYSPGKGKITFNEADILSGRFTARNVGTAAEELGHAAQDAMIIRRLADRVGIPIGEQGSAKQREELKVLYGKELGFERKLQSDALLTDVLSKRESILDGENAKRADALMKSIHKMPETNKRLQELQDRIDKVNEFIQMINGPNGVALFSVAVGVLDRTGRIKEALYGDQNLPQNIAEALKGLDENDARVLIHAALVHRRSALANEFKELYRAQTHEREVEPVNKMARERAPKDEPVPPQKGNWVDTILNAKRSEATREREALSKFTGSYLKESFLELAEKFNRSKITAENLSGNRLNKLVDRFVSENVGLSKNKVFEGLKVVASSETESKDTNGRLVFKDAKGTEFQPTHREGDHWVAGGQKFALSDTSIELHVPRSKINAINGIDGKASKQPLLAELEAGLFRQLHALDNINTRGDRLLKADNAGKTPRLEDLLAQDKALESYLETRMLHSLKFGEPIDLANKSNPFEGSTESAKQRDAELGLRLKLETADNRKEKLEDFRKLIRDSGETQEVQERQLKERLSSLSPKERAIEFKRLGIETIDDFYEKALTEERTVKMTVFKVEGFDQLKILIPADYVKTLDQVRELRRLAEASPLKAQAALDQLHLKEMTSFFESERSEARKILHAYETAVLPENILQHVKDLPDGGKLIKQIIISDKPNPSDAWHTQEYCLKKTGKANEEFRSLATADSHKGGITFHPDILHRKNDVLKHILNHEWSHLLEAFSKVRSSFDAAANLENARRERGEKGAFIGSYAEYNNNENWAVHIGEVLLGSGQQATDRFIGFVQLAKESGDSKLKVLIMAKALEETIANTERNQSSTTPDAIQKQREAVKARIEYIRQELGWSNNETRQDLLSRLKNPDTKPEQAKDLVVVLSALGDRKDVQPLIEILSKTKNEEVAREIIQTIGKLGDQHHCNQLIDLANSIPDASRAQLILDAAAQAYRNDNPVAGQQFWEKSQLPTDQLVLLSKSNGAARDWALNELMSSGTEADPKALEARLAAREDIVKRVESGELMQLFKEGKINGQRLLYNLSAVTSPAQQKRVFESTMKHLADRPQLRDDYLSSILREDLPIGHLAIDELGRRLPADSQAARLVQEVADDKSHSQQEKAQELLRKAQQK
jgi:hypothetical protein